jgi:very-short-patch-repair endonuclease
MAADPVEWDLFRTAVHENQGWRLQRLWTPHYFPDPEGCLAAIMKDAAAEAAKVDQRDGIRAGTDLG